MKTIFVTGVSGLLGTNLIYDLLQSGFQVRGLLRDRSKYKGINHANLKLIEGNLFDDLSDALEGADVVIHVAAETRQNLTNFSNYLTVNAHGTMSLLNAAMQCKIKKFVFVSTANTLGFGSLDDPGNEQKKIKPPFDTSFYAKSKLEAENQLLQNAGNLDIVIINPTFMLGAYDTRPSSGKIILMALKKKLVLYPPGGKNFVHVRDVSRAILKSITRGRSGEKYVIANENLTYEEFFRKMKKITGQGTILVKIPRLLLLIMGFFGDIFRSIGFKTSISSTNMKILCVNNFYSNEKSKKELGVDYHSVDTAIEDAMTWFDKGFHRKDAKP